MNIHDSLNNTDLMVANLLERFFPGLPQDFTRYALAGVLVILALTLLLIAAKPRRRPKKRNTPSSRGNIPHTLQSKGMVVDVMTGHDNEEVAVRCVITGVKSRKIRCEIIERMNVLNTRPGDDVVCIFAPVKTNEGRVNSFTATLLESGRTGRKADRIELSAPADYAMIPRRRHPRKRVADQQFIRVKLWMTDHRASDVSFEDATPQIGVNSFSTDTPDHMANGVINISGGGIGLSVLNRLLPETCVPGKPVVINLFMFNFREKTFEPYWYGGTVRSMEEGRPGSTRLGIEFTASARPAPDTGQLVWHDFSG